MYKILRSLLHLFLAEKEIPEILRIIPALKVQSNKKPPVKSGYFFKDIEKSELRCRLFC